MVRDLITTGFVSANGQRFETDQCYDGNRMVLFLHGFPELVGCCCLQEEFAEQERRHVYKIRLQILLVTLALVQGWKTMRDAIYNTHLSEYHPKLEEFRRFTADPPPKYVPFFKLEFHVDQILYYLPKCKYVLESMWPPGQISCGMLTKYFRR
jgi:hypothetical protein